MLIAVYDILFFFFSSFLDLKHPPFVFVCLLFDRLFCRDFVCRQNDTIKKNRKKKQRRLI